MKGELAYNHILYSARNDLHEYGVFSDRTGVGCTKVFNKQIDWGYNFPFCTTRPLGIRTAWEEMKIFLSGNPDTTPLSEKGITFWEGNTSREFLDNRGLTHLPVGSLGTSYSKQFRNVNGLNGTQIDQLSDLVNNLKSDPYSRRHAIDLWGVGEQSGMPLLPCWYRSNWYCTPTKDGGIELHLILDNRSLDILLGYFQAAMQYKLLQIAICKMLGFKVGKLVTRHTDCHVYLNQYEYVDEMLERDWDRKPNSSVTLDKDISSIDDIVNLEWADFIVEGYNPNKEPFKAARPPMAT